MNNIIKDIERNKIFNDDVSAINQACEKAIEITTKGYLEEPCFHNIVVKFYGTIKSYGEEKPLYICLGCNEDLTEIADEIENDPTKYIIDFTSEYWYFVSKKTDKFYALVDYLRDLAIESSIKMPDYTDADFTCMVNANVKCIMQNNNFKQCG